MNEPNIDVKKCTNCKCWRALEDFIGATGLEVKRCLKCREKDNKQKQKPEVREKKNVIQKEKKYYQAYRDKKRTENEDEFLQHNAEIAKNWRNNNKEHLSAWRKKDFITRITAIKQQALKKGIEWSDTMTYTICKEMMSNVCFYCNYKNDDILNGIDRINSNGSYTIDNCKPCCKCCNFMKKCLDINTFIKRCKHISKFHNGFGYLYPELWVDTRSITTYNNYKDRAIKKELEYNLTLEQFNRIRIQNCYYCGKENTNTHHNGVDRIDSNLGYSIDNCVSCCGECNYMKGKLTDKDFIEQCQIIATIHDDYIDIVDIPIHLYTARKNKI